MILHEDKIDALLEVNKGQCNKAEYRYIARMIMSLAPANILVFGLGLDSHLWTNLNKNGTTVFLEHNEEWFDKIDVKHKYKVEYTSKKDDWYDHLNSPQKIELPQQVEDTYWDLIYIDSPEGHKYGRMQSIYTASTLWCDRYLVHDCDREIEAKFASKFLGEKIEDVRKLWFMRKW